MAGEWGRSNIIKEDGMTKDEHREISLKRIADRVEGLNQAQHETGDYPRNGTLRSTQIRALAEWLADEMFELKQAINDLRVDVDYPN